MRLQILLGVWCVSSLSALSKDITVRFEVTVPRHFAEEKSFFVTGNHPSLGDWEPDKAALTKHGNAYTRTVLVPENFPLEFKVTRGKWRSSEVAANGSELPNRTARCERDCTLRPEVENFGLPTFHAVPEKASPHVFYHHEFYSEALANYRNVAVYLPAQYFTEPGRRFPVLYSLDGNNLFDTATMGSRERWEEWRLDETLDDAFASGRLKPFIVVGIYNTKRRADEYVPCQTKLGSGGGLAGDYLDFLGNVVKPRIDQTYRTKADRIHTGLMGSSFGGTFTLFASKKRPDLFSRYLAMSSAFWPGERCLFGWLKQPTAILPEKVWMDMGDREEVELPHFTGAVADLHKGHELLKQSGVPENRIKMRVEKDGYHNEAAWGKRVEEALRFAFAEMEADSVSSSEREPK